MKMSTFLTILAVFAGTAAAVALVCGAVFYSVKRKLGRLGREIGRAVPGLGAIGSLDSLQALANADQETPRSLNGCDQLLLPRITKDFPDFNPDLAKSAAVEALKAHLGEREAFKVHNTVLSGYERYGNEKVILFQIAAQYQEGGTLKQKRYILHYTYLLSPGADGRAVEAAHCPNCGAALPEGGSQVCRFCGSLLAQSLPHSWRFTQIREG